jgi:hypothetical protein
MNLFKFLFCLRYQRSPPFIKHCSNSTFTIPRAIQKEAQKGFGIDAFFIYPFASYKPGGPNLYVWALFGLGPFSIYKMGLCNLWRSAISSNKTPYTKGVL